MYFLESLKGARVLVTGASTGIGEQLAYHYARLGAQLVITARRGNVLEQVNFLSYVQMTQKALPALEKSNGSIVVVSSLLGKMCGPFALPYAATKFALNGFFGGLQHELAMQKSNVSITICILGLIDTDSAMEKIKGYINMTAYPAHEAAWHIIEAGASRQPETFYPWYTFYACLFRDWFPYLRDQAIQNSYTYNPQVNKEPVTGS
uniref:Hydroxysteroid 11-beta-dehydrogenase 1-like protein n=1 Tax=Cyprinus carpio TaxID=7962 RepID=A0A8C2DIZ6_CYPCA